MLVVMPMWRGMLYPAMTRLGFSDWHSQGGFRPQRQRHVAPRAAGEGRCPKDMSQVQPQHDSNW